MQRALLPSSCYRWGPLSHPVLCMHTTALQQGHSLPDVVASQQTLKKHHRATRARQQTLNNRPGASVGHAQMMPILLATSSAS